MHSPTMCLLMLPLPLDLRVAWPALPRLLGGLTLLAAALQGALSMLLMLVLLALMLLVRGLLGCRMQCRGLSSPSYPMSTTTAWEVGVGKHGPLVGGARGHRGVGGVRAV